MTSEECGPLLLALDELTEGTSHLNFATTAAALGLEDPHFSFAAPVQVRLQVRRALEAYTLSGNAQTWATTECCRCLARAEVSVQADISLFFQRKEASADELEATLDEEGMEFISPGEREVDLTALIHDALILSLPVRVYCRDDCRGLCVQCGKDLNEGDCGCTQTQQDPRWEALKSIAFS